MSIRNKDSLVKSNNNAGSYTYHRLPDPTPFQSTALTIQSVTGALNEHELLVTQDGSHPEESWPLQPDDFTSASEACTEEFMEALANTPGWQTDIEVFRKAMPDYMLVCSRHESAWSYGTMTHDDYHYATEDDELVASLHEELKNAASNPGAVSTLGQTIGALMHGGQSHDIVDTTGAGTFSLYRDAQHVTDFTPPPNSTPNQMWAAARQAIDLATTTRLPVPSTDFSSMNLDELIAVQAQLEQHIEASRINTFARQLSEKSPGARYLTAVEGQGPYGEPMPVFQLQDYNGEALNIPSHEIEELSVDLGVDCRSESFEPSPMGLCKVESKANVTRYDLVSMLDLNAQRIADDSSPTWSAA